MDEVCSMKIVSLIFEVKYNNALALIGRLSTIIERKKMPLGVRSQFQPFCATNQAFKGRVQSARIAFTGTLGASSMVHVDRRQSMALTHFRCRRVDGSRPRPSEILPCPEAFISIRSSRSALSSIIPSWEQA